MKHVMVRYQVKSERVADNERLIAAVFAELERSRPTGLRYRVCKLPDGTSFVPLATIDTADGSNPLLALAAFKEFSSTLRDRASEPPVSTELSEIHSYG